jgi:hypothetical protein
LDFILVIIGLLVCLLLFIFTIYFKSREGSPKKLVSGKLVGIILIPLIILLFKLTTKDLESTEIELPLFWLAVYFFIIAILLYFFKMAEMVAGFESSYATTTPEQKEKISRKASLFCISLGFYSIMVVGLKYVFSEISVALLMIGGIFFGVAKLNNAKFSMLIGIFYLIMGIFSIVIQVEGIFAELALVFSTLIAVYILFFEVFIKGI